MIPALMCVAAVAALCTVVFWQRGMAGRHAEMYAAGEREAAKAAADREFLDALDKSIDWEGAL